MGIGKRSVASLALALGLAVGSSAWAAPGPVSEASVPRSFLEGTFYFGAVSEGGSELDGGLAGSSDLVRVRFAVEDRFLVVYLAEDAFSNPKDPSLVSILARFPVEAAGDRLKVRWGDDPSPFVLTQEIETSEGTREVGLEAAGAHDVHGFELDEAGGYLTFVKAMRLVGRDAGTEKSVRIRYNFLRRQDTGYQPLPASPLTLQRFGFFAAGIDMLADEEIGHLEEKAFVSRIDVSKTWTWQIHPTVPEVCHKPIRDAAEAWNDVFEARIGKRPLAVVPGAVDRMPGDLRHHVIYFRTRGHDATGYSAFGPPVAISHTGEIVDADIIVDGVAIMGHFKSLRLAEEKARQKAAAAAGPEQGTVGPGGAAGPDRAPAGIPGGSTRPVASESIGLRIGLNGTKLRLGAVRPEPMPFMDESGEAGPGAAPVPAAERFYQVLRGLITHEMGHNLGLRHNFGGSADVKQIESGMVSTSIMDYVKRWTVGDKLFTPGPYDRAAIAAGYGGKLAAGEENRFLFLTDRHARTHFLANRYDLGDPLAFYTGRIGKLLEPLRAGRKPTASIDTLHSRLDSELTPIVKFVNAEDPRAEAAFTFLFDMLTLALPGDAKYRAVDHVSSVRLFAAWFLTKGVGRVGRELTRNQRRAVATALADAIGDSAHCLEGDRLKMVELLGGVDHVTARSALRALRESLEGRLDSLDSEPKRAEIEENVLMHVEKALKRFSGVD